jgi:4-carboxymuconolactone decarboxylase
MADDSRRERGKRKMEAISQVPAFDPPDVFTAATVDQVFGNLWQRPGLSDRERRLLSIAIVGARGLDFEARTHIRGALKTGDLSSAEMMEVILHVAHYAGWPHASVLYRSFRALCAELDLEVPGPEEGV